MPGNRPMHARRERAARRELTGRRFLSGSGLILTLSLLTTQTAFAEIYESFIQPSDADSRVQQGSAAHYVTYDTQLNSARVLVWMTGTGGTPAKSKLLDTALEQGYRVIALSYINKPAVAQFCIGSGQTDCAEKFRDQRVFGRTHFEALPDRPHDSIVSRLSMLFRHLARHDPDGLWEAFISNGQPDWEKIVVAGHSQGGGMAAFIAKRHKTARVVVFSGGWDNRGQKGPVQPEQVAAWYSAPSATPVDRWIVAYQTRETNAASILESYRRLGVPDAQIVRFTADIPPDRAHLIPIRNAENHPTWRRMFGNGRRQ